MKKGIIIIVLFFMGPVYRPVYAQSPKVPSKMEAVGIQLKLSEAVRKEIQADVDKLTRYPKYFNIKVERANTYFPTIERIFKEENVPDDIKYLVLQESALISDAVSSSKAVGFWQFKDFTAHEMGMRVDAQVDERKNIVASSRGAARYFKKNNFYFNNWLKALQAYQMGAGGVMRSEGDKYNGVKSMDINKKTYWYVKKYLAHKIAFQDAVGKSVPKIEIAEYTRGGNKTLKEIAKETGVEEDRLMTYNKWLKRGRVPTDRTYSVIIPGSGIELQQFSEQQTSPLAKVIEKPVQYDDKESEKYPVIKKMRNAEEPSFIRANGLPAIVPRSDDDVAELAKKGDLLLSKFLAYNDIDISHHAIQGKAYYLSRKRSKARTHFHTVRQGESLWSISQKYGIRLKKLMDKNRIKAKSALKPGRVLWLRFLRPASVPIEYRKVNTNSTDKEKAQNIKKTQITQKKSDNPKPIPKKQPSTSKAPKKTIVTVQKKALIKKKETPVVTTSPIRTDSITKTDIEHKDRSKPPIEPTIDSVTVRVEPSIESEKMQETVIVAVSPPTKKPENTDRDRTSNSLKKETPTPTDKVDKGSNETIHTVTQGETLYSLGKRYNVGVMELVEWNNIRVQDGLSIGQELKVKAPMATLTTETEEITSTEKESTVMEEPQAYTLHEVKPGETMYNIARSYGVSIKDLMAWNRKSSFDLSLGEKLKIKKQSSATD